MTKASVWLGERWFPLLVGFIAFGFAYSSAHLLLYGFGLVERPSYGADTEFSAFVWAFYGTMGYAHGQWPKAKSISDRETFYHPV